MMVPKIVSHAASVIAQNKKLRLNNWKRDHLRSKRHSPSASLSGNSTDVLATPMETQLKTAQSNRTQGYVTHF